MFLLVKSEQKRCVLRKIRIELNLHILAFFVKHANVLSLPVSFNVVRI